MKKLRRASSFLLGMVFFIAAFLKLADPLGASLVVEDYLKFLHLGFLSFLSGFAATSLALLECIAGIALICGVFKKISRTVSGILLGFFTLLTLAILIFNPAIDCGCFGQAIKLSHSASFIKNIVLCLLWTASFVPFSSIEENGRKSKYAAFWICAVSMLLFTLRSHLSLPVYDFTPAAPGNELFDENADYYMEDGDFILSFTDTGGEYSDSLALDGKVIAVSCFDLPSGRKFRKISDLVREASSKGYRPLVLVAASKEDLDMSEMPSELAGYVYFADRRTLMTLNRSNGGATLIGNGQILRKWSSNAYPSPAVLEENLSKDNAETIIDASTPARLRLQAFLLYVAAIMLLL